MASITTLSGASRLHYGIKKRITMVLVYTVLEWALLLLLFIHSLLSIFITSFASYFSLRPLCLLCSLFSPFRDSLAYRDHLCESHMAELSRLSYCKRHQKLSEGDAVCGDCSSSSSGTLVGRCCCCNGEVKEGSLGDLRETQVGVLGLEVSDVGKIGTCGGGSCEEGGVDCKVLEQMEEEHAVELEAFGSTETGEKSEYFDCSSLMEIPASDDECDEIDAPHVAMECTQTSNVLEEVEIPMPSLADGLERDSSGCIAEIKSLDVSIVDDVQDASSTKDNHVGLFPSESDSKRIKKPQLRIEVPEVTWGEVVRLFTIPSGMDNGNGNVNEARKSKPSKMLAIKNREVESKQAPDTPVSVDSGRDLDRSLIFDQREIDSDSVDGSIEGETDVGEALTVEQLQSALQAERRALSALYAELEEERNASSIAANHTLAMISRLQEEKAAIQMEALQYKRMMEEQSEYDQEALQLLNELMVKRERENQELEKELDIYRRRVFLYEEKERTRTRARVPERSASSSEFSSVDGSDDFSYSLDGSEGNFSVDANGKVSSVGIEKDSLEHHGVIDGSLADFEKERLSILDHLKELEEKLFLTGDDNGITKDMGRMDHLLGENGDLDYSLSDEANGFYDPKQRTKRRVIPEGKNLLPLFDAISVDNEEGPSREEETESDISSAHMKISVEEELNGVYERLYALEADREFLKHSLGSLKKGDKGMDLLLEILQHLRDLRSLEFQDRDASDVLS